MPSTRMERNDKCDAMVMDHDAENDRKARHLLQKLGFDPDHIHQYYLMDCSNSIHRVDVRNVTPLIYFILRGNLPMCQYLLWSRGADGRTVDSDGHFPLYWAAYSGHLAVVQFLCGEFGGGARDDIRNVDNGGTSPLRVALLRGQYEVVQWLILHAGALSKPRQRSVIHEYTMRRGLRPELSEGEDPRRAILAWVHTVITTHETLQLVLAGTLVVEPSESESSESPLVLLNGHPGILELIAAFVERQPTRHELRISRHLRERLLAFIDDISFIPRRRARRRG